MTTSLKGIRDHPAGVDDVTPLIPGPGVNLEAVSIRVANRTFARVAAFFVATSESQVGRAIREYIESKAGAPPSETDAEIGRKALRMVRNRADAEDLVQDMLRYLVQSGHEWPIGSGPEEILAMFLHSLRLKSHSLHTKVQRRKKREVAEDDVPSEDLEDFEAFDPKLDDQADIVAFMEEFGRIIPDFVNGLSEAEKALFDVIFNDGVGSFSQDVKQNMNQGSAVREKYPDLYEKNKKRWSGFVYDTRKKLFNKLQDFLFEDTSRQFRERMREMS